MKKIAIVGAGPTGIYTLFSLLQQQTPLSISIFEQADEAGVGMPYSDEENSKMMLANIAMNRPGFPGECFICELRLPDHRFRWKHNKLFLLLPVGYGPAFPAIVDCYTSPPT
ncbi:outer membrane usher protein FimD [Escherichia coli]|nr:outer membrane usher protein FimD [Escherichia coli]